jgi:signal transduction histidine kinase
VNGPRRLSLRARMLVLLVAVTTMFLLIMGTVSAILVARNVSQQFQGSLLAELQHSPDDIAAHPNGTAAVLVRRGQPPSIQQLTPGAAGAALATAVAGRIAQDRAAAAQAARAGTGQRRLRAYLTGTPFAMSSPAGPLMAVARQVTNPAVSGHPFLVVAQPTGAASGQVRQFVLAELITGVALVTLLAIGGEWLIGRGLDPLGKMAAAAHGITTRGDLTARMPDADEQTEVGLLGAAINTMLDRIQQAFGARLRSEQKVREFAADASHELRTPLTTIRGYAELYRQGALGPDQLPNAMRRIEQEAERMSTLVAELLELARLDRTSSLDLAETDLAGVVRDAVADAAAVQPRRPVRAEAPPRLVAVVDEPRIRQVLANLLGNVRAHTPVTAPVVVRLGAITGGILIEVADGGPGMSQQDAARAFDRFHRAPDPGGVDPGDSDPGDSDPGDRDPGDGAPADGDHEGGAPAAGNGQAERNGAGGRPRVEGSGSGSGLGLSIVAAIAHAHGGQATLESRPGQGTKVRVWLPARITG